jgi:hypothetical protein
MEWEERDMTIGAGRGCPTSRFNGPRLALLAPAAERRRWADQSESTTTMTTKGGIVGRGGGLVIWEARL